MSDDCSVVFFKHKTAYYMRMSDWSSDVCSSDLLAAGLQLHRHLAGGRDRAPALHVVDLVLLEEELDTAGEVLHHLVLASHHGRKIQPQALHLDAVRGEVPGRIGVLLGRLQQRLGGNAADIQAGAAEGRSEEHTSELQSLMRTSYAVYGLK